MKCEEIFAAMEMLEKGSVPTPLDTLENFLEVIKSIYLKNRQNPEVFR